MIGGREVKVQHPEDRRQDALSLAQWQVEDEPERQRGVDREVRVLPRPSTLADARLAVQAAIASDDTHTVTSPRRTRAWL